MQELMSKGHHGLKRAPTTAAASRRRDGPSAPAWPSYTVTSQLVGTSQTGVTVYVDPSLGAPGLQNANDLLADADRVVTENNAIFGTPGGAVSVIVFALGGQTDGTGGADHMSCDYITGNAIEVCAAFGQSTRVSALFEAELSECSMGGNLCGINTGEALSRWCAADTSNNALSDFATAPTWFQGGMTDYVDQTDPTDQNPDSTGCGMAFLSWLMSQGHSLETIAPAMVSLGDSGTLAQLYAKLTGDSASNAWSKFISAVRALPDGVTSDDPFGGAPKAALVGHLQAPAIALAGELFSAILAGVSAGRPAQQIVQSVHTILASKSHAQGASAAACRVGSRRLRPPG